MTNYSECFIYEIVHLPTGKKYTGSSCNKNRWSVHKSDKNLRFSKFIKEEGIFNFKFNRLYDYPCSSLTEQLIEEQNVLDKFDNTMLFNINREYTPQEYKKEKTKQWFINNRTKWNEYQKNWRKNREIKTLYND